MLSCARIAESVSERLFRVNDSCVPDRSSDRRCMRRLCRIFRFGCHVSACGVVDCRLAASGRRINRLCDCVDRHAGRAVDADRVRGTNCHQHVRSRHDFVNTSIRQFSNLVLNLHFHVSSTMPRIKSDDAEIFYEVLGDGPPVVLLHPFPVHHEFWLPAAQSLLTRYRLILPDLRGHGESGLGEGPATMAKHANDIARVMDDAGIGRAAFAGVSIGGYALFRVPATISRPCVGLGSLQYKSASRLFGS